MPRPVRVLAGFGLVLGVLGAIGWHRQLGPFSRTWPPAWVVVPPGGPRYSGSIAADAVSDWSELWWPAIVVLPLFGMALGALLGLLLRGLVSRRHRALGGFAAITVLGLLAGVAAALAWHVDPGSGIGWVGGLEEAVDVGYPVIGIVLGLLTALAIRRLGATDPPPSSTTAEAR